MMPSLRRTPIYILALGTFCSTTVSINIAVAYKPIESPDPCLSGVEEGAVVGCDDGDPCTRDTCVDGYCVYTPRADGASCHDGDPCTIDDVCVGGVCSGALRDCADADLCTVDSCVSGGCVHDPMICDDGDPCTIDFCAGGTCTFDPMTCPGGNTPICYDRKCVDGTC